MALVFLGIGTAAQESVSYLSLLNDSIKRRGFSDDITTYSMVSAVYNFSIYLGYNYVIYYNNITNNESKHKLNFRNTIGSAISGVMIEYFGYKTTTFILFIIQFIMVIIENYIGRVKGEGD